MIDASNPDWFVRLADTELDALHRHVRLVYPLAETELTVRETFRRAARGSTRPDPPTPRSWLRQLARLVVIDAHGDSTEWRRLNAAMIQLDFRDGAEAVSDPDVRRIALGLADAMTTLSLGTLEVLRMLAVESLDFDEIAHVLGTSTRDAATIVDEARTALRMLNQANPVDDSGEGSGHDG